MGRARSQEEEEEDGQRDRAWWQGTGVQGRWSEGYFQRVISGAGKEGVVDGQARENLSWVEGLGASLSDSRSSPARVV